jgi:hypothetical protein
VEGLVLSQPAVIDTAKDLLIQLGKTRNGPEESRSTESMSPPVQAEIADNDPEPRHKRRGPLSVKLANPSEVVSFESLTDKDEAIVDSVLIALEEMDDLEDQRGVPVQELIPRFFVVLCQEGRKPVGDPRIEPHSRRVPSVSNVDRYSAHQTLRQLGCLLVLTGEEDPELLVLSLSADSPLKMLVQCTRVSGEWQALRPTRPGACTTYCGIRPLTEWCPVQQDSDIAQ